MKNVFLIFLLAFSCSTFAQTIRRCNNNPGVTGVNVYTTIQDAHDAAAAGDIIYVEPSVNTYGSLNATKRLTIIGNGYYNEANPNTPFEKLSSIVNNITFNNGSANSFMSGIHLKGNANIQDTQISITRCLIIGNCNFGQSTIIVSNQYSRGNNGIITKCIVIGGAIIGQNNADVSSQFGYNTTVSNCIFRGGNIINLTNSTINNNTCYLTGSNAYGLIGCSFTNNILDARGLTTSIEFVSGVISGISRANTISNNICLGQSATPSGNGNVSNGDINTTFLIANPWSSGTDDAPFQLAAGSPAIGIGTGGTNAGAFGGASPYILSGLPAYPVITNFTTTGVGNTTTPLQVNVTVRGNN